MGRLTPFLLVALLVGPALALIPGASAAIVTYTEDFESQTEFIAPVADWYTVATSTGMVNAVSAAVSHSGDLSWRYGTNGQTTTQAEQGTFYLDLLAGKACNPAGLTQYKAWINASPPSVASYFVGFHHENGQQQANSGGAYLGFRVDASGAMRLQYQTSQQTSASYSTTAPGATGGWVDLVLTTANCGAYTISSSTLDLSLGTGRLPATAQTMEFKWTARHDIMYEGAYSKCDCIIPYGYVDDIVLTGVPAADETEPEIGAAETVAVDSLSTFDVSESGQYLLTRQNGVTNAVKSYSAHDMAAAIAADDATYCNKDSGLSSQNDYQVYTSCTGGTVVDAIKIRTAALADPYVPGCSTCDGIVTVQEDDMYDVNAAVLFGLGSNSANEEVGYAFGFTTTTGYVGAYGRAENENGIDSTDVERIPFHSAPPQDYCSTTLSNGRHILGAVHEATPTKFYEVTAEHKNLPGLPSSMNVGIKEYFGNGATFGNAVAVDCAGDYAIVGTLTATYVINLLTKEVEGQALGYTPNHRGVAISADASYAVVVDEPVATVLDLSTGNAVATLTTPNGAFKGVEMDGAGAYAWVATTDNVARYRLQDQTCQSNCLNIENPTPGIGTQGESVTGKGAFGALVQATPMGNLINTVVSLMMILGTVTLGWVLTGGRIEPRNGGVPNIYPGNSTVIMMAGMLGMSLAVILFGFPFWIPLLCAVVGIGLVVYKFTPNSGGP